MSIIVITGPMFAGKSTELMRYASRHTIANQRVLMVKYAKDQRYTEMLPRHNLACSHDQQTFEAVPVNVLDELDAALLADADVICIDEGQFFEGLTDFCNAHADAGKTVIVAGLSSTFQRKPFYHMARLMACAEQTHYLTAICIACHREAHFTRRLGASQELVVIGGEDLYVPCCRGCWNAAIDDTILSLRKRNVQRLREMRDSTSGDDVTTP